MMAEWTAIRSIDDLGDPSRSGWRPFWLMTLADHGDPHLHPFRPSSHIHAHLLFGGVPYDDLIRALKGRPYRYAVRNVYDRWGVLHYVCSQESSPWRHGQDKNSYCHALLCPPLESDNLEYILQTSRRRAFAAWGRRSGHLRSRQWRHLRAKAAARARWEKKSPPAGYM